MVGDRRGKARRKIVLLDLENMLFGEHKGSDADQPRDRSAEILELAQARRPGDTIIVGCNPHLVFLANELFPGSKIVTGKGKDGADQALIDALDLSRAIERYDELCIVSGDHLFCEVAHPAHRAGLTVRIVAPHAGLSTALRVYADTAVFLPEDESVERRSSNRPASIRPVPGGKTKKIPKPQTAVDAAADVDLDAGPLAA